MEVIITVPQTVVAYWEYQAELPEGNWEFSGAEDFKGFFTNKDTGELLEVPLHQTGEVEYDAFEGNEWESSEAIM